MIPQKNYLKLIQRLRFFAPYRKRIILLGILEIFSASFLLAGPYFSKLYIDKAFLNKNMHAFLKITGFGAVLFLLSILARVIRDITKKDTALKMNVSVSKKFIKQLFSLDLSFFQSHSVGENFYRISDVDTITRFITEDITSVATDLFRLGLIFIISVFVDYRLTAVMFILSPLFFLQSLKMRKKIRSLYEQVWKSQVKLSKRLQEGLSRILAIKAFGWERFQRHAYIRLLIENMRLGLRVFRWSIFKSLTASISSRLIYGIITIYGGWLIIKGRLSLGTYTAAVLYIGQLGGLLESFASRFEYFIQKAISLDKFFEVLEAQASIKDSPDAKDFPSLDTGIIFDSVTFGYNTDKQVFEGLNLHIPTRRWVAIVGPSGCGKTTLVNLILRLYEPQSGKILIGSQELRRIKIKSLRDKIAIATQEPLLFDFSLKENIGYGLRHLNEEDIHKALELVQAEEFVKGLKFGIDTNIGENAVILSQGYKQRIALARAIVREPELLLLDEATSSIDSQSEEKIFRSLSEVRVGKSTIVISHRLSSIADADRIFFLSGSAEIEEGTHEALIEKSNKYREFFHAQLQRELDSLEA